MIIRAGNRSIRYRLLKYVDVLNLLNNLNGLLRNSRTFRQLCKLNTKLNLPI